MSCESVISSSRVEVNSVDVRLLKSLRPVGFAGLVAFESGHTHGRSSQATYLLFSVRKVFAIL